MLKRITIYICAVLFMVSCYSIKKPKKPDHLLSKKEMVNIILDLRLLASANGANQRLLQNHGIYSEDYVYKKYNIDSATFAQSNNYYAFYIEDYDEIYNKVKDSLDELKTVLDELVLKEKEEKRKTDSINRVKERDSLNLLRIEDSLREQHPDTLLDIKLKRKIKPKLIEPVSETTSQSQ